MFLTYRLMLKRDMVLKSLSNYSLKFANSFNLVIFGQINMHPINLC